MNHFTYRYWHNGMFHSGKILIKLLPSNSKCYIPACKRCEEIIWSDCVESNVENILKSRYSLETLNFKDLGAYNFVRSAIWDHSENVECYRYPTKTLLPDSSSFRSLRDSPNSMLISWSKNMKLLITSDKLW